MRLTMGQTMWIVALFILFKLAIWFWHTYREQIMDGWE